jgi:L-alanine-DL-glutamate epimerase-like enolase superfamily enzyme
MPKSGTGVVPVPQGPGLGIAIDEAKVAALALEL